MSRARASRTAHSLRVIPVSSSTKYQLQPLHEDHPGLHPSLEASEFARPSTYLEPSLYRLRMFSRPRLAQHFFHCSGVAAIPRSTRRVVTDVLAHAVHFLEAEQLSYVPQIFPVGLSPPLSPLPLSPPHWVLGGKPLHPRCGGRGGGGAGGGGESAYWNYLVVLKFIK